MTPLDTCDKTQADCVAKFDNLRLQQALRGFPGVDSFCARACCKDAR